MTKTVRAAGGVVYRMHDGVLTYLVTHRPRYDDWSLPKGKRDEGETDEDCALREVLEETGLAVELGTELAPAEYVDHKGRPKIVRYWLMRPVTQPSEDLPPFEPNDEVDEVRWLDATAAAELLSYDHDRVLVVEAQHALMEPGL